MWESATFNHATYSSKKSAQQFFLFSRRRPEIAPAPVVPEQNLLCGCLCGHRNQFYWRLPSEAIETSYSPLSDSVGFNAAARRSEGQPNNMPTAIETRNAGAALGGVMIRGQSEAHGTKDISIEPRAIAERATKAFVAQRRRRSKAGIFQEERDAAFLDFLSQSRRAPLRLGEAAASLCATFDFAFERVGYDKANFFKL